jgi:hypothetical protein
MKSINKVLLVVIMFGTVCFVNAADTVQVDKTAHKVMLDRKYLAEKLDGATVEEMANYIIEGIKNVDASDLSDEEKLEAITLGIADIVVIAGDKTEELMKLVVAGVGDSSRMQIAVAVTALSGRSDKSVVLDSIYKQLGGVDTELGKLAKEAADDPVAIIGQRLRVLVERIVLPAKSLSSSRLAGGARTLPLPPIRRPEGYGEPRPPVDKYSGQ